MKRAIITYLEDFGRRLDAQAVEVACAQVDNYLHGRSPRYGAAAEVGPVWMERRVIRVARTDCSRQARVRRTRLELRERVRQVIVEMP